MSNKLELSIEHCFQLFGQSFNRVKFFSCITDSVTSDIFPNDWSIKRPTGVKYGITKTPPTEQEISMLVSGYKHFIQRYLVRDCIENFAACLDELFFILLLEGKRILPNKKWQDSLSNEESELFEGFKKAGLIGKMQALENHFKIQLPDNHKRIITSLKDIRNCLSHNNGTVRPTDGKKDGKDKRKFHWIVLDMFAVGKSGNEFEIEFEKPLKEEAKICIRLKDHFKSFPVYQPLSFSSSDTYEIALSLDFVARQYLAEVSKRINLDQKQNG